MTVRISAETKTAAKVATGLSDYTDDELISLTKAINEEIVNRKLEKTAYLHKGEYAVGTDIPAGTYLLQWLRLQ